MKTTLELPDELARRIKVRAAERDQRLKDTIAQLLELGLANASNKQAPVGAPKPIKLKNRKPLTTDDIEAAIVAGRD